MQISVSAIMFVEDVLKTVFISLVNTVFIHLAAVAQTKRHFLVGNGLGFEFQQSRNFYFLPGTGITGWWNKNSIPSFRSNIYLG